MRDSNDNLDRIYEAFKSQSEDLRKTYEEFNAQTERSYQAFKKIMEDYPDIGRTSMVIMARNLAHNLISVARDKSKSHGEIFRSITAMICPMFQMMYDRLVSETIEAEMSDLCKEGEEN